MNSNAHVDAMLVQWGDRLFYPGNRRTASSTPKLKDPFIRARAAEIRARIAGTVRRAPQVMVKVTGGGRGMLAIAAHFRYITKNGRLDVEDERGQSGRGKDAVHDLVDDWRWGGTLIEDVSPRREAFNIMLSMPKGTDPVAVLRSAREFAQAELADHKYVMVLHDHQANPHVHLSVRAESKHGKRLNPRRADLQRWRETFAEKLRGWGVEAEASRQAVRGPTRRFEPLWRLKAAEDGRLRVARSKVAPARGDALPRSNAVQAWREIEASLASSDRSHDRGLARSIAAHMGRSHQRNLER
jgi:hypothetical protein